MSDPVQLKTAEQVRDDILAAIAAEIGVNDRTLGSVVRTMAYAVGSEADEIYYQLWRAQRSTFIRLATGISLDNRAADYGLVRRSAVAAVGTARFSGVNGTIIPPGSVVFAPATPARDAIRFSTPLTGVYTIGGGIANVPISAQITGAAGNLTGGSITQMEPIVGVAAVTNPLPTTRGEAREGDDSLRDRLLAHISGLSLGTPPAIRGGALNFEVLGVTLARDLGAGAGWLEVEEDLEQIPISVMRVINKLAILDSGGGIAEVVYFAGIDTSFAPQRITGLTRGQEGTADINHTAPVRCEEWIPAGQGRTVASVSLVEPPGRVVVHVDDGTVAGAHAELVSIVQHRLRGDGTDRDPGYRAAGIILDAFGAIPLPINIVARIVVSSSYDAASVATDVESAQTHWLNSFAIGEMVYGYECAERIMGVGGVVNVAELIINGNAFDGLAGADIFVAFNRVARVGTLAILT